MDYELPEGLLEMARRLMETYERSYQAVKPIVNNIINNKITDIDYIDHVFDSVLDIPTDKAYELFLTLCEYVATFNKEVADDYLELFDELYGDEDASIRKK